MFGKLQRVGLLVLVLVLMLAPIATATPMAYPSNQNTAPPIRLKVATFTPAYGEAANLPPGLVIAGYAQNQRGYYIVQFAGPVLAEWRVQLEAIGGEIVGYIPDFAYKVRMNPGQARQAEQLANVIAVLVYQPGFKLSPDLVLEGENLYQIRIERGSDFGMVRAAIATTGAELVSVDGNVVVVAANPGQVQGIAHVVDVAWVQNFQLRERHNESGAGVIMGANTANDIGYTGSGQIVAVADTGLGGGTAATAHAHLAGRVAAIFDWPASSAFRCYDAYPDGAQDVDSGHGTHVALSVLGSGDAGGLGKGTAPGASLIFQSVEDYVNMKALCSTYPNGYYLVGIPNDIRQLFQQAYNAGARIHSNSWGSNAAGDYTVDSANLDDFMWRNPAMLVTTSAGNAGTDANRDGVIDNDSIGSPATAKNVLTVGASENERANGYPCDTGLSYTTCSAQGGQNNIFTYGGAWPNSYPADPIASDPSAGDTEQMAAFSSRGPTDDGRIKPDVVAPGTWILSGYSDLYQQGYDASPNPRNNAWQYDGYGFPYSAELKYMSGTSMSNPLVAGAAAVVRQYYQTAGHNASAALVKATLINTAVDMLDENNNGIRDNAFPIPNVHEGWGRVNIANATRGSHVFVDSGSGLNTNGDVTYPYDVAAGSTFKVTLVWTDFPSTESASKNLVNDLDLVVTSPSGTIYSGNLFSGGWSQSGGSADRTNNVENVYIQSAEAGTWTVEVRGFNVPNGPQPFALVVDRISSAPPVNQSPTASFTYSCTELSCSFDGTGSSDSDGNIVSYDWTFGDGSTGSGVTTSRTYAAGGTYTVNLTVTDNDGATNSATQNISVSSSPGKNTPPTASFTYNCSGLSCTFDGTGSSDSDGNITNYVWDFGDEATATGQTTSHTYGAGGSYNVTLTVTDNGGATDAETQPVTVIAPPPGINLSVNAYKVKGEKQADLTWSGATSTNVDVYRNGSVVATTANDGTYTDRQLGKGGGSAIYKVCEAGTTTCSNEATATW
jgi:PKD repeat protein/subtilisin family serine protease